MLYVCTSFCRGTILYRSSIQISIPYVIPYVISGIKTILLFPWDLNYLCTKFHLNRFKLIGNTQTDRHTFAFTIVWMRESVCLIVLNDPSNSEVLKLFFGHGPPPLFRKPYGPIKSRAHESLCCMHRHGPQLAYHGPWTTV